MCGIAGLFSKSRLDRGAARRSPERDALAARRPRPRQRRGRALPRPGPGGACKVSLFSPDAGSCDGPSWHGELARRSGRAASPRCAPRTPCSSSTAPAAEVQAWLRERHPELRVMSVGERIEIYKEAGDPRDFVERFGLAEVSATHALGHTRMATESRVTTEHSHPFSTGLDLCLVHNGSLSNHNRLRAVLRRKGIEFQTDNDSEVAAGYLTWRLSRGRRPRAGAARLPRRPRRLLHLRRRHRRRLRRPARPDRLQAGGDGRDRRLGRDGLRVPGDRGRCRAPTRRSSGSPSPAASTPGSGRRWRERAAGRRRVGRPGDDHRRGS